MNIIKKSFILSVAIILGSVMAADAQVNSYQRYSRSEFYARQMPYYNNGLNSPYGFYGHSRNQYQYYQVPGYSGPQWNVYGYQPNYGTQRLPNNPYFVNPYLFLRNY